ncbi:H/ACA ribonucleoprotein complex subunit GAR1 [Halomarina litorea]|uniref:H/ACA ribonucleoprotein complex subunit GAR1 n=1 Tax=Halomarina litorea TaxID=2961595 RepID=UPI0020C1F43B|nr:Gar1/Naf1 family protein [Halomarina sp. BCD28]
MKRVGEVVRTAQGLAVLRCPDDDYPDIGTMVIDEDLKSVGRVVDVFGPESRPYAAVTPDDDVQLPLLLGKAIYAR